MLGEADVRPADGAELAAAGAGGHRHPEEDTEIGVVRPCGVEEGGSLVWLRRMDLGGRQPREGRFGRRVAFHPTPADRVAERPPEDAVDLPHGAWTRRPALVWPAPSIARVGSQCPVVDSWPAVAKPAASSEVGVGLVQHVHAVLQHAELPVTQNGPDGAGDEALVHVSGVDGEVGDAQPAVQQHGHGGLADGLPPLLQPLQEIVTLTLSFLQ